MVKQRPPHVVCSSQHPPRGARVQKVFARDRPRLDDTQHETVGATGILEVLAVEHTPADRIPEVGQRPDDSAEISSTVRAEETCNVFE